MWTTGNPALHYRIDGTGDQTVLMLHEVGGSLVSWDDVVALSSPILKFVRFDQRGAGLSEKSRQTYGRGDLIEDIEAVLSHAGITGPFSVCAAAGASAVAVVLAAKLPKRVTGLVLCSPALEMSDQARTMASERARLVAAEGMRSIIDKAMDGMFPPAVRTERFDAYRSRFLANDPVGFACANLALAEADWLLPDLDVPVSILAGRHDIRSPQAVAQAASFLRNARIQVVEAGGHVLPVQAPGAVAEALAAMHQLH